LLVPSKFYGIAAASKPIIFIGDKDGELARLVRQHACGLVIAPGDAGVLVDNLRQWINAPAMIAEMGQRARNARYAVSAAARACAMASPSEPVGRIAPEQPVVGRVDS
jgi:hypothetical protein